MTTEIIIEDTRWTEANLESLALRAVDAVRAHLGLDPDAGVVVMGCDDERISALNADFRGKHAPTNVLSWPAVERASVTAGEHPTKPDGPEELGDIAIAYETTRNEAKSGEISLEDHTIHLIVHGTLHLLGYDHVEDADGDLMESIETAILAGLGIADPYSSGMTMPNIDGKD